MRVASLVLTAWVLVVSCGIDERGAGPQAAAGAAGAGSGGLDSGVEGAAFGGTSGDGSATDGEVLAESGDADGASEDATADQDAGNPCEGSASGAVGLTLANGLHCYWLSSVPDSFGNARSSCQAQGGYLATVHSDAENLLVSSLAPYGEHVWVGGSDGLSEWDVVVGAYSWLTNEPFTYTHWAQNGSEPDVACGDCDGTPCNCQHRISIRSGTGDWYTRTPKDAYAYVCESGPIS